MRKLSLLFAAGLMFSSSLFAQETESASTDNSLRTSSSEEYSFTSKNGHEVLPQAGDWSLGLGASSSLYFIGNMLNGNTSNNSGGSMGNYANKNYPRVSIYGKKLISSDLAYRGGINIFYNNTTTVSMVDDDLSSNANDMVADRMRTTNGGILVAGGIEKRRGSSRVQGVYGAEVYVYKMFGSSYNYLYGNVMSAANQNPTSTAYGNPTALGTPAGGTRISSAQSAGSFQIGARAFVGVEYFIAPKLSLGAEMYWGLAYTWTGKTEVSFEGYDGLASQPADYTLTSEGSGAFSLGVNNIGGAVNLYFYF